MKRRLARILVGGGIAVAALAGAAGPAGAAQPAAQDGPAVWLVPGGDLGGVLGPTVGVPTALLAPVNKLLTVLHG
ncbi:hypothetical protein [Sciscionella marina]|uniref:hypothetical protein n=1 Tax=Sciscionella marina TaxID=508770 RepID=UPI00036E1B7B|nr:hypothetical protein [Sciscionella marina]